MPLPRFPLRGEHVFSARRAGDAAIHVLRAAEKRLHRLSLSREGGARRPKRTPRSSKGDGHAIFSRSGLCFFDGYAVVIGLCVHQGSFAGVHVSGAGFSALPCGLRRALRPPRREACPASSAARRSRAAALGGSWIRHLSFGVQQGIGNADLDHRLYHHRDGPADHGSARDGLFPGTFVTGGVVRLVSGIRRRACPHVVERCLFLEYRHCMDARGVPVDQCLQPRAAAFRPALHFP